MALWTNVDNEAGKPKNLTAAEKAATLGINADETSNQKATHAGWVLTSTGSGGRSGRVFNETLVAMGSMTGDNDTVDPDPVITIGTQPLAASVTSPAPATYTVVATATRGADLTYQWQVANVSPFTIFANVSGPFYTGGTSATLTVTDTTGCDGYQFRCIVSSTGATPVTSTAVALTVA
jgi:hypothetical protein